MMADADYYRQQLSPERQHDECGEDDDRDDAEILAEEQHCEALRLHVLRRGRDARKKGLSRRRLVALERFRTPGGGDDFSELGSLREPKLAPSGSGQLFSLGRSHRPP